MLAAVHLDPVATLPVVAVLFWAVIWYWRSLGGAGVPRGRRRIRRHSMALIAIAIVLITLGTSFVDAARQPVVYIAIWSGTLFVLLLIVLTALLDALYTLGLHRRDRTRLLARSFGGRSADGEDAERADAPGDASGVSQP